MERRQEEIRDKREERREKREERRERGRLNDGICVYRDFFVPLRVFNQ